MPLDLYLWTLCSCLLRDKTDDSLVVLWPERSCCTTLPPAGCSGEGVLHIQIQWQIFVNLVCGRNVSSRQKRYSDPQMQNPNTKSSIFIFKSQKYIYKYTFIYTNSLFICMSHFYIFIFVFVYIFKSQKYIYKYTFIYTNSLFICMSYFYICIFVYLYMYAYL